MDYGRVYREFIEDRRGRETGLSVWERHHVLPRCLGSGDEPENLIKLSPGDHLFAHILLARIHGGQLAVAAVRMLGMKKYTGRRSRLRYASLRREHARVTRLRMTARHVSEGTRRRLSEAHSRPEVQAKINTPESRRKKSMAGLGKRKPESFAEAIVASWQDPAVRAARTSSLWGRRQSLETREKRRLTNSTPEAKERSRAARLGIHNTPEHNDNIRASWTPERRAVWGERVRQRYMETQHAQ